ncbi:hypothetical protein D9757_009799 [Collybiopsis confluens]|uniref:WD40 repeat-like protein n=1 Tax=Collybiopsis confluens TaxID=2823264 RepID=A0A8H5HFM7_9AGAR|nr:hypothetical protein D9757_009799 [Collybiopsis confluens]
MTPSTYHLVPHLDLFVVGTSVCYLRLSLCSAALLRRLALLICHIIAPHPRYVPSDLFVTDGSKIVSGSDDMTVCIWDAIAGKQLAQFGGHSDEVTSAAFSPDGSKIVSGSDDKSVHIWDVVAGQQHTLAQFKGPTSLVIPPASFPYHSNISSSFDTPTGDTQVTNAPQTIPWLVDPQQWLCLSTKSIQSSFYILQLHL